jgi:DNA-binding MarR family transcriptional regulator
VRRPRPSVKPRQHARRPGAAAGRNAPLAPESLVAYRIATLESLLARGAARGYLRRFALAAREWRILAALGEGRPLSADALARRTAIGAGQVTRAAASLARRGLVAPEADAFDARRTLLRLSRKGRALYRRIAPVAAAHERALLAGLSAPERRVLQRLLARLHERAAALLEPLGADDDEGA